MLELSHNYYVTLQELKATPTYLGCKLSRRGKFTATRRQKTRLLFPLQRHPEIPKKHMYLIAQMRHEIKFFSAAEKHASFDLDSPVLYNVHCHQVNAKDLFCMSFSCAPLKPFGGCNNCWSKSQNCFANMIDY